MKKILICVVSILVLPIIFLCVSCSDEEVDELFDTKATMPFGTDEYKAGEWTEETILTHLKELGFEDIEITNVVEVYGGNDEWKIHDIQIEDPDSMSFFTEYRTFDKGEKFDKTSNIIVETYISHATINVDNNEALRDLVNNAEFTTDSPEVLEFFKAHSGEYIEFDGVITYCYDYLFYVNFDLDFDVQVENSTWFEYSWDDIEIDYLDDCGWGIDHNMYYSGCLSKGDKVHMVCKIYGSEEEWSLTIKSFDEI